MHGEWLQLAGVFLRHPHALSKFLTLIRCKRSNEPLGRDNLSFSSGCARARNTANDRGSSAPLFISVRKFMRSQANKLNVPKLFFVYLLRLFVSTRYFFVRKINKVWFMRVNYTTSAFGAYRRGLLAWLGNERVSNNSRRAASHPKKQPRGLEVRPTTGTKNKTWLFRFRVTDVFNLASMPRPRYY